MNGEDLMLINVHYHNETKSIRNKKYERQVGNIVQSMHYPVPE